MSRGKLGVMYLSEEKTGEAVKLGNTSNRFPSLDHSLVSSYGPGPEPCTKTRNKLFHCIFNPLVRWLGELSSRHPGRQGSSGWDRDTMGK